MEKVKIDDVEYDVADLSDLAKQQIGNIAMVDQQIKVLQQRLFVCKTAKSAYSAVLKNQLTTVAK